ncbi:MAG: U32 family peptidase [Acutalibacteraceae bacterium]|jgi:putative protease
MKLPEILAPVGSAEMLEAAVRCGADAVYMGASAFHARRHSHAFTGDELTAAIAYAHARGTKVHITLNTLIREEEREAALAAAKEAANAGADALIVQDIGLAAAIRAAAPDLPLHASTQLSCHTPAGVKWLREQGFSRVVLAREMALDEIAACAGLGCELEVFVHGALCMSVSGQCYFSAMLGGRSGNRGLCAQTCRLPFRPDGSQDPAAAALSLKDLNLLDHLEELAAIGVDSLKIEGRMKRPEYVAAAVTAYRAAARGERPDPQTVEDLRAVFSRSGFTDGYLTGKRDAMFGTRRQEDVVAAAPVLGRLQGLYNKGDVSRVTVDLALTVAAGRPGELTVTDGEHTVTVTGETPERALHRPLDADRAADQLRKTGGSPFLADAVTVDIGEGLTMPLSALNALRRQALDELMTARAAFTPPAWTDLPASPPTRGKPVEKTRLIAQFADPARLPDELDADGLILPLHTPPDVLSAWAKKRPLAVAIPRGMFGQEDAVRAALKTARAAGATHALCGNVGAIPLAIEAGLKPVGGFSLNITNRGTLDAFARRGLAAATLSMELTFRQGDFAAGAPIPTGWLVYGRQPLMLTRQCPRIGAAPCGKTGCGGSLTDRMDKRFPLQCAGGCVEVLNADPLYWADRLDEIPPTGFWLLSFTDETPAEAADMIRAYREGGSRRAAITRGLYRRGVE